MRHHSALAQRSSLFRSNVECPETRLSRVAVTCKIYRVAPSNPSLCRGLCNSTQSSPMYSNLWCVCLIQLVINCAPVSSELRGLPQYGASPIDQSHLFKRQAVRVFCSSYDVGPGTSCATDCGNQYAQCQTNDGLIHCYNAIPMHNENCCGDTGGQFA
jgi:hypothetical protein